MVFSFRLLLVVLPSSGTVSNSLASVIMPYHIHVTLSIYDSLEKINAILSPELQSAHVKVSFRDKFMYHKGSEGSSGA